MMPSSISKIRKALIYVRNHEPIEHCTFTNQENPSTGLLSLLILEKLHNQNYLHAFKSEGSMGTHFSHVTITCSGLEYLDELKRRTAIARIISSLYHLLFAFAGMLFGMYLKTII